MKLDCKILNEMESVAGQLREAELKAAQASKSSEQLDNQLADMTQTLEDETRQKLAANSKLRALEQEKEHLLEQLDEEESKSKTIEKNLSIATTQLQDARKKAEEESENVARLE